MLDIQHIGERIRETRKKRMMTIKVLSEYTGLSVGYLSTLEQNKTTPTIDSLARICDALHVKIADILDAKREEKVVIRRDEMKKIEYPLENMDVGIVDFGRDGYVYEYIIIQPGEAEKLEEYRHVHDEIGMVVKGEMSVRIEGETFRLREGDSICVKSGHQHAVFNEGDEESVSVWAIQRNLDKLL